MGLCPGADAELSSDMDKVWNKRRLRAVGRSPLKELALQVQTKQKPRTKSYLKRNSFTGPPCLGGVEPRLRQLPTPIGLIFCAMRRAARIQDFGHAGKIDPPPFIISLLLQEIGQFFFFFTLHLTTTAGEVRIGSAAKNPVRQSPGQRS